MCACELLAHKYITCNGPAYPLVNIQFVHNPTKNQMFTEQNKKQPQGEPYALLHKQHYEQPEHDLAEKFTSAQYLTSCLA